jgi:hypothetical protein
MAQDDRISASAATSDNLDVVASFSDQEAAAISRWQTAIERISAFCGSAAYFAGVLLFILIWAGVMHGPQGAEGSHWMRRRFPGCRVL